LIYYQINFHLKKVLDSKLVNYISRIKEEHGIDENFVTEREPQTSASSFKHPNKFKPLNLAGGMHMRVPACITPRVQGFAKILNMTYY
jgi:hypothetical protein